MKLSFLPRHSPLPSLPPLPFSPHLRAVLLSPELLPQGLQLSLKLLQQLRLLGAAAHNDNTSTENAVNSGSFP